MAEYNDAFGRLKSSVNRGVATISVKAGSTIEKTRIKTHIDTLRTEIDKLLSEAGSRGYEIWCSGAVDYAVLGQIFMTVAAKKQEIAELRRELEELPEKENQILGKTENTRPRETAVQASFCSVCGTQISPEAKFCVKCGARLK